MLYNPCRIGGVNSTIESTVHWYARTPLGCCAWSKRSPWSSPRASPHEKGTKSISTRRDPAWNRTSRHPLPNHQTTAKAPKKRNPPNHMPARRKISNLRLWGVLHARMLMLELKNIHPSSTPVNTALFFTYILLPLSSEAVTVGTPRGKRQRRTKHVAQGSCYRGGKATAATWQRHPGFEPLPERRPGAFLPGWCLFGGRVGAFLPNPATRGFSSAFSMDTFILYSESTPSEVRCSKTSCASWRDKGPWRLR